MEKILLFPAFKKYSPGLVLCIVIALAAKLLASFIPLGAVALAILVGILVGNFMRPGEKFKPGVTLSEKHLLSIAIALLGVKLDFMILKELGYKAIILVILGVAGTLLYSQIIARLFKFNRRFALLLGIGNGICGSSAIAATERIIGAREEEVGLSIAIVNFLGTIGIFLVPFLATFILKLPETEVGVLVGNTLQAVGQVVAGGFSVGDVAGQTAIIIKMARILMLFPVVFILIIIFSGRSADASGKKGKLTIPGFIIGFILLSMVPTFKLLPPEVIAVIGKISHYALIVAMAGIGMKITIQTILTEGKSALAVGASIFCLQLLFSSGLIWFLF